MYTRYKTLNGCTQDTGKSRLANKPYSTATVTYRYTAERIASVVMCDCFMGVTVIGTKCVYFESSRKTKDNH